MKLIVFLCLFFVTKVFSVEKNEIELKYQDLHPLKIVIKGRSTKEKIAIKEEVLETSILVFLGDILSKIKYMNTITYSKEAPSKKDYSDDVEWKAAFNDWKKNVVEPLDYKIKLIASEVDTKLGDGNDFKLFYSTLFNLDCPQFHGQLFANFDIVFSKSTGLR